MDERPAATAFRPLWLLPHALPPLVLALPGIAPMFSVPWCAAMLYYLPGTWLFALAPDPKSSSLLTHPAGMAALCLLYSALIAFVTDCLMRRLLRGRVTSRRAATRAYAVAGFLLTGAVLGQYGAYRGLWGPQTVVGAGNRLVLREVAGKAQGLRTYTVSGFIDEEYLATFQVEPRTVTAVLDGIGALQVHEEDVPDVAWRKPPYWWRPAPRGRVECYRTAEFSFADRGQDGNHYFAFVERQDKTATVYLWAKENF
jgi:hypothetical protein